MLKPNSQMAFSSYKVMERYALINLGVRIDLPGSRSPMSKEIGKAIDETGDCKKQLGPHVAIGEINYARRPQRHPHLYQVLDQRRRVR